MKRAMITGVTGQDGSYLAEFLLARGYEVHGVKRRASSFNTERVDHLYKDPLEHETRFHLHYGDMTDATNLIRLVQEIRPDEIYNLAAQSHVKVSFETAEYTGNADALGTLRLLEAIRLLGLEGRVRFYQASSSELYGKVQETPQTERTPFYPRSPYAAAKLYAYWMVVNYREAYGMFASNGILFNHESPRRGETFVSRKITRAAARIALGLQQRLHLGNLDARRDWGHARDYVDAMWRIVQHPEADDFVIATGTDRTVRAFTDAAFGELGLTLEWSGQGVDETARLAAVDADRWAAALPAGRPVPPLPPPGAQLVGVDRRYFRPSEVDLLRGDATKARERLGWTPRTSFAELVREMVSHDLADALRDLSLSAAGYPVRSAGEH